MSPSAPRPPRRGGLAHLTARALLAVASGLALWASFPGLGLWWLAPVGVAALADLTLRSRARSALLLGLVAGLAFFVPTLSWSGVYVGRLPWFALATLESLYVALMGSAIALVGGPLWRRGHRFAALAVVPLAWVAQELARSTTPFGGFPWARLAFSQADGPLARVAAYGGAPGVTFAVAAVGAALLALRLGLAGPRPRRRMVAGAGLVVALGLPLAAAAVPLPTDGRRATVALVQGNVPEAGLEFNAERRKVLDNHAAGTAAVAARHVPGLSLVVWPENSSDIDPFDNPDADQVIRSAVAGVGVPVIVGAVLDGPGDKVSNASLYYRTASADPQRYVKQHPVPFAEYIPYRSFFRHFSDKVDLVRRDFAAGRTSATFSVPTATGPYAAVPTICFEIAYDGLVRDALARAGSTPALLVVQTNNATFGYTAESEQQFAISRIRAIEHGRSVAHVSTVGVSGFIGPDGTPGRVTSLFTADQVIGTPTLRTGETVSDRLGNAPEIAAVLALVLLAGWGRTGRRASRVEPPTDSQETYLVDRQQA